jgi:hypothetical protein
MFSLGVETFDDCECEHLRGEFLLLREEYQLMHGRTYDDYCVWTEEAIKGDPKTYFLKKKRVDYPSVIVEW